MAPFLCVFHPSERVNYGRTRKKVNKGNNFIGAVLVYYLPLLAWMGVIFLLSSLPGNPDFNDPKYWVYISRKSAHIIEYFILTILFIRLFSFHLSGKKREIFSWTMISSLLYGYSDEIHQVFVFGRDGKVQDIFFDVLGMLAAILIYNYFINKKSLIKEFIKKDIVALVIAMAILILDWAALNDIMAGEPAVHEEYAFLIVSFIVLFILIFRRKLWELKRV